MQKILEFFFGKREYADLKAKRYAYGRFTAINGLLCNLLLFGIKILIGIVTASISIISDAFNNLSDCLSSVVSLVVNRIASKPADRSHPFGHGRMEYVGALLVENIILVVGVELLLNSINEILNPHEVKFSWPLFIILTLSILFKLWLVFLNRHLGKAINNLTMLTVAQDALGDILITCITLATLLLSNFNKKIPFDGIGGLIVSLFIIASGLKMLKEIIDVLIGKPNDLEMVKKIAEIIRRQQEIFGVHDILVHEYGNGVYFASAHAEIDQNLTLSQAHDIADKAENDILKEMGIMTIIHLDPLDIKDEYTHECLKKVKTMLNEINSDLSCHDFRVMEGKLSFDVLIPYHTSLSVADVEGQLNQKLAAANLSANVTYDHSYTAQ